MWFVCCKRGRNCQYLYADPLLCSICAGLLKYASIDHSMPPNVQRLLVLRRRIGAPEYPRAIARQPRARHRIYKIMRRIWAEEAALVGQNERLRKIRPAAAEVHAVQVRCKWRRRARPQTSWSRHYCAWAS